MEDSSESSDDGMPDVWIPTYTLDTDPQQESGNYAQAHVLRGSDGGAKPISEEQSTKAVAKQVANLMATELFGQTTNVLTSKLSPPSDLIPITRDRALENECFPMVHQCAKYNSRDNGALLPKQNTFTNRVTTYIKDEVPTTLQLPSMMTVKEKSTERTDFKLSEIRGAKTIPYESNCQLQVKQRYNLSNTKKDIDVRRILPLSLTQTLYVVCGDIRKIHVDVIIIAAYYQNGMQCERKGLAKTIDNSTWREMSDEVKKSQHSMDIFLSGPNDLPCKKIFCVIVEMTSVRTKGSLHQFVKEKIQRCLKIANENSFKSIAIPGLFTSMDQHRQPSIIISIADAIKCFCKGESASLTDIHFCDIDNKRIKMFEKAIDTEYIETDYKEARYETDGRQRSHGYSYSTFAPKYDIQRHKYTLIEKDEYKEIVRETEYRKMIYNCITHKGISLDILEDGTISLSGEQMDVMETKSRIENVLRKLKEAKSLFKKLKWGYNNALNTIEFFHLMLSYDIEMKYRDKLKKTAFVEDESTRLALDFASMKMWFEADPRTKLLLVRKNAECTSGNLDAALMSLGMNVHCVEEEIDREDHMHTYITENFKIRHRGKGLQIFEVKNGYLFSQYRLKKELLEQKNGIDPEHFLWHGTTKNSVGNIIHRGFNRSYCGKNGTKYGKGVYFATESDLAISYADSDIRNDTRHVFLARVAVGKYCKGNPTMHDLPAKPGSAPHDTFDSACDDVSNPKMFVIFNDVQAYPAYHIVFQKGYRY